MFGSNKAGFTFLELMVVVAIVALMATIVIPRLGGRSPAKEREQFVMQLNGLLRHATADAVATNMIHKIVLDIAQRRIFVEQQTTKKDSKGQSVYAMPKRPYAQLPLRIPVSYDIKNVIIEGFDEMTRFAGGTTKTVFFYIMPQGLAQTVTINFLDRSDGVRASKGQPIGLVLNPLSAQFRVYNAFQ